MSGDFAAGPWLPNSSHWGAFEAAIDPDGGIRVRAHPRDPEPSPLLDNIADSAGHPTRVARPSVRRGWLTDGPGPDDRRGHNEFIEVDWDHAIELVAGELARVRGEFGNSAIFGGSYGWSSAGRFHHAQSQLHRFLNGLGGYTRSVNSYSHGASAVVLPHVVGAAATRELMAGGTSWSVIAEHTDLVVAFGGLRRSNLWMAPGGKARHGLRRHWVAASSRGMRVANVTPIRDDLPGELHGDWYRIVPGSDVAAMLALSTVLIDDGLADLRFLRRYTEGAERHLAYLRGDLDGVRKDPTWAEGITGIPAADLTALARQMAAGRTFVTVSWALQRAEHGEQVMWAGIALAAMLGQIGLPGGGFGHGYGSMGDVGDGRSLVHLPSLPQGANPVDSFIPVARIADMLLSPGTSYDFNGQRRTYPDARLVYWSGGNPFHHHQDLSRLRRAFTRPDTVIVHEPYWTATARHADIVLPVATALERHDLGVGRGDTHMIAMKQIAQPWADSRTDFAIFAAVAEQMGFGADFTEGRCEFAWVRHLYDHWRTGLAAHELPDFDSFWERGEVPLPAWRDGDVALADFRGDPDGRRLGTPSGRIELYSKTVAGFGYADAPGQPWWFPPQEWLGGARARDFPLHLIANQPATRLHSQLDHGRVSQASKVGGREPIRIHPTVAADRGIADGDVVRVWNDRGSCLAGAVLSEDLHEQVVQLSTGAWFDPSSDIVTCVHGNPNVLTADRGTSRLAQASTGQHALVEVERFDGPVPPVTVLEPPVTRTTTAAFDR